MILADKSNSRVPVLLGLMFMVIPSIMLVAVNYMALVLELNCQKTGTNTANCLVQESRFWGLIPFPKRQIPQIRSARINSETYTDSEGDRVTRYWITLQTATAGTVSLTDRTDGLDFSQQNQLVNELNVFLANDRARNSPTNFLFTYDGRRNFFLPFMNIFISMFLFIGIALVVNSLSPTKQEQIILDKNKQMLIWLLPESFVPSQYELSQITAVEIHKAKIENRRQVFQVYLLGKSRGLILIEEAHSQLKSANRQAKLLGEFLRVPIYERSV